MANRDDLKRATGKLAFGGAVRDVFPVAEFLGCRGIKFGGEADPTMGGTPQR